MVSNEDYDLEQLIRMNEKYKEYIKIKDTQINILENMMNHKIDESTFNNLKNQFNNQLYKNESKDFYIKLYEQIVKNKETEINYLNTKHKFLKRINSFLSYVYIFIKSKREMFLNFKLFKKLKNTNYFDAGYYLRLYPEVSNTKCCKYLSPELHYVCYGFDEKRRINLNFVNYDSKKHLLEDINSGKLNKN